MAVAQTTSTAGGLTPTERQQLNNYTGMLKRGGAEYLQYGPAIDNDTSLLVAAAKERKALMEKLAVKDPGAFLRTTLSALERQRLPATVQPYLEKEAALKGPVTVVHKDDFKNPKNSSFEFYLRVGPTNYRLALTQSLPVARSGAVVTANAYTVGQVAVVKRGAKDVAVTAPAPPPEALGAQKTLVLLMDYKDSGPRPFTKEQIQTSLNNGNVQNFFKEQSYGRTSVSADVYGWIQLNKNAQFFSDGWLITPYFDRLESDPDWSNSSFFTFVKQNNIPLGNYGRVVLIVSHPNVGGGWSGVGKSDYTVFGAPYRFSYAYVGVNQYSASPSPERPFSMNEFDYVFDHEFGHSLGVLHANRIFCDQVNLPSTTQPCEHREYGNRFDTMGQGYFSLHFNVFYKYLLGWLTASDILSIKTSGSYTMQALEQSTGKRGAIIFDPQTNAPLYALETRQPIGYDSKLTTNDPQDIGGLIINRIIPAPFPQIIDIHPRDESATHALHPTDAPFRDDATGLVVGSKQIIAQAHQFDITLNTTMPCKRAIPTLLYFYASPWVSKEWAGQIPQGSSLTLQYSFMSEDSLSCTPSSGATVTIEAPSGWSTYTYPEPGTAVAASKGFVFDVGGSVQVPENTSPGSYNITVRVTGVDSPWSVNQTFPIEVVLGISRMPGDTNGDGKVTATDALFALKTAVGTVVPGFIKQNADVDCSGAISATDALLILKKAVGQIPDFPVCGKGLVYTAPVGQLTVNKEGSGLLTPAFSGSVSTTTVTLTPTAAPGYMFAGFSGSCTGTTCALPMSSTTKYDVTATFKPTLLGAALGMVNSLDLRLLGFILTIVAVLGGGLLWYSREPATI
jgi:M6 family metalloprotease-like protein